MPPTPTSLAISTSGGRLKREDFSRTKHDSDFTDWKILIGPSDWEDHLKGEGAERYRTQNLPNCSPCPGLYELGIGVSCLQSGREARKFDSSSVAPVYLGQADNLRNRLQQYGRDGAHLENGFSNEKFTDTQCVYPFNQSGLFTFAFSTGFPIVFRYALMESKKEAEMAEKELLGKFDYAWNKGSNGVRRYADICKKLHDLSKASQCYLPAKKLLDFNQKPVGTKIRTFKAGSWKNDPDNSETDGIVTFSSIIGIKKVQPEQVKNVSANNVPDICGVVLDHGSVCTTPPVKGRERCAMHKGMRVNSYISKLNTHGKACSSLDSGMESSDKWCSDFSRVARDPYNVSANNATDICGVMMGHGSVCTTPPVKGRVRCAMHKGMRVNSYISKLNTPGKTCSSLDSGMEASYKRCTDFSRVARDPYACKQRIVAFAPICGFILANGSPCQRNPVPGNKRCLEHKGRRIC